MKKSLQLAGLIVLSSISLSQALASNAAKGSLTIQNNTPNNLQFNCKLGAIPVIDDHIPTKGKKLRLWSGIPLSLLAKNQSVTCTFSDDNSGASKGSAKVSRLSGDNYSIIETAAVPYSVSDGNKTSAPNQPFNFSENVQKDVVITVK